MAICGNCGADPCYHICPNSEHFYSPEQERADDAFYGQDDVSERYAGERLDAELWAAGEDEAWDGELMEQAARETREALASERLGFDFTRDDDEIPF